ncbi:AIM24 family protein [Mycobacterium sp. Y57]|uniref:AIM24 family protein n=1 Tax=Mycolicibacterium xanthum TaxID=2796469 RepID=UPI001C852D6C|nr:AIM24 family protein [Mycolicibacterium xanthum]MBX7433619.1 AIM24 family protein [Mycolicibacterium xanthum]
MTGPGQGSWQPDPEGRYEYRWHDGRQWTDQVSHQGQVSRSPLGPPPAAQPSAPASPQHQAMPAQPVTGAGDGFSGITGDLVDGRYSEKEAKAIANQNAKLLRVRLGEPFMARQGSMVAYQGNVDFSFEGGGASKFLKKAFTGEGLPLMRCAGQGDVFLAEFGYDVHLLNLTDSGLSVSGKNVLAFSSGLDWNIERVKGGSIATGGLFNTTLRGTGWVAITTDGPPVVLNAAEAPTFADTNAVVAWSAHLQTQLKSSFKAGALIGRGSGEALQVSFHGQGFVIIQPSEGVSMTAVQ